MRSQPATHANTWAVAALLVMGALVMVAVATTSVHAPAIAGDWTGSLSVGDRSLALAIHIARDKADIPVQRDGQAIPGEVQRTRPGLKLVLKLRERM